MNNVIRWGFALGLLPLAACAGNPPPPPAPPAPPPLAAGDAAFITAATQGGLAEIAEAQIAQKNSRSPAIQNFAQTMITDHTQANNQLAQIAAKKGVTPPASPSDAQTQEATALSAEHGPKFNRDYIADQIADHKEVLAAFQQEATSGTDPDLKAFAEQTEPTIQHHIEMADEINAKMMGHHGGGHYHHHHHHTSAS
jgi:putative membrane protein